MKVCRTCGKSQHERDFYAAAMGRKSRECKECTKAKERAKYANKAAEKGARAYRIKVAFDSTVAPPLNWKAKGGWAGYPANQKFWQPTKGQA